MHYSSYDIKQFYGSRAGKLVRRLLSAHLYQYWPDMKHMSVAGYGYPMPFLRDYKKSANCVMAMIPAVQGLAYWDGDHGNLSCAVAGDSLPLESEVLDRFLIVHGLEFSEAPELLMAECWRVLKSGGRMIIILPSRLGLWARNENTPFGYGRPFSVRQIETLLQKCNFQIERRDKALFMPPFRSFFLLRSAYTIEGFGKYLFPALHGIHIIEVSKKVYAGVLKDSQKISGKARHIAVTRPSGT